MQSYPPFLDMENLPDSSIPVIKVLIVAVLCLVLPLCIFWQHMRVTPDQPEFKIMGHYETVDQHPGWQLKTEISALNIESLSGSDNLKVGEQVFVHLSGSASGVAYPFSITRTLNAFHSDPSIAIIRAKITSIERKIAHVEYFIENTPPPESVQKILASRPKLSAEFTVGINPFQYARLKSAYSEGYRFDYHVFPPLNERNEDKFMQIGAERSTETLDR